MAEDNEYTLPVSFYFSVGFMGGLNEVAFKEVSGLSSEMEVETLREGGENSYELKLPKQVKHSNLVLKRALMPLTNTVEAWIKLNMESNLSLLIVPDIITISLCDADGIPLRVWSCVGAFPVKWEVDTMDAEKNSVLIETLELAYSSLTRIL